MLTHASCFHLAILNLLVCVYAAPVHRTPDHKDVQPHTPSSITVGVKGDLGKIDTPHLDDFHEALGARLQLRANASDDKTHVLGPDDVEEEIVPKIGEYYQEEWVRHGVVVPAPLGKRFADADLDLDRDHQHHQKRVAQLAEGNNGPRRQRRVVRWAQDSEGTGFEDENREQDPHEEDRSAMLENGEHGMLDLALKRKFNVKKLVPICVWHSWSGWSPCSVTCSCPGCRIGYQSRSRGFTGPCSGATGATVQCTPHRCPIHCSFAPWSTWDGCSKTCNTGLTSRYRSKSGPFFGGWPCAGRTSETLHCNQFECPVDCSWVPWHPWGACSLSCGGGKRQRHRVKHDAVHGGKDCSNLPHEEGDCNVFACAIDCYWKEWEEWTQCPQSCGVGALNVRRRGQDPEAQYGGVACLGVASIKQPCNDVPCPQDCVWNQWGDWEECSQTCGLMGRMQSKRHKLFYVEHGGAECKGEHSRETQCNVRDCPVDCVWEEWLPWSNCSVPCGGGNTSTIRNRIHARFGGAQCNGTDFMTEFCNEQACPEEEKNGGAQPSLMKIMVSFVFALLSGMT